MVITGLLSPLQALKESKDQQPNCFQFFTYVSLLVWAQRHCFLQLEYRAMSGLMFWPRLQDKVL